MDAQTPPAAPSAPAPGAGDGSFPGETPEQRDIRENKDIAAFSYLWIMSVIVFFLRRDSPFVRFHSKQAMILFLVSIPVWLIPYVGRLLALLLFGGMVMGFLAAAQGERKDVPIVGRLSRREITVRQAWQEIVSLVGAMVRAAKELLRSRAKETGAKPAAPTPPPAAPVPAPPAPMPVAAAPAGPADTPPTPPAPPAP